VAQGGDIGYSVVRTMALFYRTYSPIQSAGFASDLLKHHSSCPRPSKRKEKEKETEKEINPFLRFHPTPNQNRLPKLTQLPFSTQQPNPVAQHTPTSRTHPTPTRARTQRSSSKRSKRR
jgi:hypothetical protein